MAPVRIAVEGCGHGSLNAIYETVKRKASERSWETVDLVIIGGDFQALRNAHDATCLSVPDKYKQIGDFHEYYSGARIAPYLTIFIGGNHEASNYLFELHYGGWVAPNIYYLGAANIITFGPLRIAGMSGIWKGYDYRKPHFERLPYNRDDVSSIYHVREVDVRKLLQVRTQVDIGLSHDWPKGIEKHGDFDQLFRKKSGFRADSDSGKLGNVAAREALDHLRPAHWFSAHLHVHFVAEVHHAPHPAEVVSLKSDGAPLDVSKIDSATPNPRSNIDSNALAGHRLLGSAVGDEKTRIEAWQNFGTIARENELADSEAFMRAFKARKASDAPRDIKFDETAKIGGGPVQKFVRGADGERIEVSSFDDDVIRSDHRNGETSHNADKIEIASSPASSTSPLEVSERESSSIFKNSKGITEDVNNADKISLGTSPGSVASMKSPRAQQVPPKANVSNGWGDKWDVDDNLVGMTEKALPEAKVSSGWGDEWDTDDNLVGVLNKDLPDTLDQPHVPVGVIKTLPAPADITNTVTKFLTLDKPHSRDPFVELLEIEHISEPHKDDEVHPLRLRYDEEWLAITRVFAQELHLGGNPNDSVPAHKGYEYYQHRIAEEQGWIKENVMKPGKMDIPHNFSQTAPVYDPSVSIDTREQPVEYTNPQTSAFCELLQIENKFALTDAQRQARMEAGPRREAPRHNFQGGRGGARGGRGGRGGRGNRGNRGGRGRGRGGNNFRGWGPEDTW